MANQSLGEQRRPCKDIPSVAVTYGKKVIKKRYQYIEEGLFQKYSPQLK